MQNIWASVRKYLKSARKATFSKVRVISKIRKKISKKKFFGQPYQVPSSFFQQFLCLFYCDVITGLNRSAMAWGLQRLAIPAYSTLVSDVTVRLCRSTGTGTFCRLCFLELRMEYCRCVNTLVLEAVCFK